MCNVGIQQERILMLGKVCRIKDSALKWNFLLEDAYFLSE